MEIFTKICIVILLICFIIMSIFIAGVCVVESIKAIKQTIFNKKNELDN